MDDFKQRYTDYYNEVWFKPNNEYAKIHYGEDVYFPGVNGVLTFRGRVNPHDINDKFEIKNRGNLRSTESGINLYKLDDTLIISAHGSKKGNILFGKNTLVKPKELVEFLESNNKISEDIKRIYTLSCYGGTQESFVSSGGRPVKSSHTSKQPIHAAPYIDRQDGTSAFLLSIDSQDDLDEEFKKIISEKKAIVFEDDWGEEFEEWRKKRNTIEEPKYLPSKEAWEKYEKPAEPKKLQKKPVPERPKPEPVKNVQKEAAKEVTDEAVEKTAKNSLKNVKLSGKGKAAIGIAAIAGIAGAALLFNRRDNNQERPKKEQSYQREIRSVPQPLQYGMEQQIAKDMSSYKYGKHMTGFVNF